MLNYFNANLVVLSAAATLCSLPTAAGFVVPAASLSLNSRLASGHCSSVLRPSAYRTPSLSKFSMIYTPPRIDEQDEATLDALKMRLDRAVQLPSQTKLPSRSRDKPLVPRSPCTSLYGNWRPTTGTEPYKKTTRMAKVAARPVESKEKNEKKARGRPPGEPKPAVMDEQLPDFVARAAHVLEMNGGAMDSNLFGQHWKVIHVNSPLYAYKSTKAVTIHQMLRENGEFFEVSETDRQKVKMFTLKKEATDKYIAACRESGALVGNILDAPEELVSNSDGVAIERKKSPAIAAFEQMTAHPGMQPSRSTEQLPSVEDLSPLKGKKGRPKTHQMMQVPVTEQVFHDVPVQGRARMASHDRRVLKSRKGQAEEERKKRDKVVEELPAAPLRHPDDALARPVISLYNSWAMDGRDVVMEVTHRTAFDEMWAMLSEEIEGKDETFTAVDAGSGNGWAARLMAQHELCAGVKAVDGAALMVEKAIQCHEREAEAAEVQLAPTDYIVGDVEIWFPEEPVDIAVFGETLYLLDDPQETLRHVVNSWLKPGGRVMASLDCYKENKLSHTWEEDLGVEMHCIAEKDWKKVFKKAGLHNIELWRAKAAGPWQGTLIVTGTRA